MAVFHHCDSYLCAHCTYSCSMRLMENMFLSSIKSVFLWYYSRHLNRWHVKIRINGSLMDFIKWATSMLVTKLNLANRIKNESISVYDFFFWNSNLYINNKINGSGVIGFTCPSQILIKSPKYDYTNYLDKHKKSKHINGIMSISIVHFCSPFIDEKKTASEWFRLRITIAKAPKKVWNGRPRISWLIWK